MLAAPRSMKNRLQNQPYAMLSANRGKAMKPKSGNDPGNANDRRTEDEIAREHLGGPRGSKDLPPAPMTPEQRRQVPPDDEPGHTA
jgi:hypothetical protein